MKSHFCLLAALLMTVAHAARLPAECVDCGGATGGGPDVYSPYGDQRGCGGTCRHYYSEQEWLAADWCQCCLFNWGYEHNEFNALTPRFRPTWRVETDMLFLMRDGDRYAEFATLGPRLPGGTNAVLTSDTLGECFEGGLKTTVSRSLSDDDNLLIEGIYFGLHEWEETNPFRDGRPNAIGGVGTLASPFTNFGQPVQVPGFDFNTLTTIGYTSEIESAELHLRHRTGLICGPLETSLLFGVRYMRISESFNYSSQSVVPVPGTSNTVTTQTGNQLLGFQLGALSAYRVSDRWWLEMDVKATLAQNSNEQETLYTTASGAAGGAFFFNAHQACTAMIGDINLVSYYQLSRYLAVKAGYQAVFVDGVAVAVENFSPSIPVLTQGPAEVNDNGTLVFHGPHLGAVFTW